VGSVGNMFDIYKNHNISFNSDSDEENVKDWTSLACLRVRERDMEAFGYAFKDENNNNSSIL
jgi:hypothetical protein